MDYVVKTPKIAHTLSSSDYSVLGYTNPSFLTTPPDTDGIPLNGLTLQVGVNESFPCTSICANNLPIDAMFDFVEGVKKGNMVKTHDAAVRAVRGASMSRIVKDLDSPLKLSEKNAEYSLFTHFLPIMEQVALLDRKIAFLNPSLGSVARASNNSLRFPIFLISEDLEYIRVIQAIAAEKEWPFKVVKKVPGRYIYYTSFRPQIAKDNNVLEYFGFQPNPAKCVVFGVQVTGCREKSYGTEIDINKGGYIDSFTVYKNDDRFIYPSNKVKRFFQTKCVQRTKSETGYTPIEMNYHDIVSTFDIQALHSNTPVVPGHMISIDSKYIIADDVNVVKNKIYGGINGQRFVLDDLTKQPVDSTMPNKAYIGIASEMYSRVNSIRKLKNLSKNVECIDVTSKIYSKMDLIRRASFERSPYVDVVIYLGLKLGYKNGKIVSIHDLSAEVITPDFKGDILVDGIRYKIVPYPYQRSIKLYDWWVSEVKIKKKNDAMYLVNRSVDEEEMITFYS